MAKRAAKSSAAPESVPSAPRATSSASSDIAKQAASQNNAKAFSASKPIDSEPGDLSEFEMNLTPPSGGDEVPDDGDSQMSDAELRKTLGLSDEALPLPPSVATPKPRRQKGEQSAAPVAEPEAEQHAEPDGKIPDWMQRMALQADIDPADYATPDALARALKREFNRPAPHQQFEQQPQRQEQQPEKVDPFNGKRDELVAEMGEKGVAYLEQLSKQHREELSGLKQQLESQQRESASRRDHEIDSHFFKLNDKYDGMFGIAPLSRLKPNSAEMSARAKVAKLVGAMLEDGETPNYSHFESAAAFVYGKSPEQISTAVRQQQTDSRIRNRQGGMVAPATQRKPQAKSPREEAFDIIDDWQNGRPLNGSAR